MNVATHWYNEQNKKKIRSRENNIRQYEYRIADMEKRKQKLEQDGKSTVMLDRDIQVLQKHIEYEKIQIKRLKNMTF